MIRRAACFLISALWLAVPARPQEPVIRVNVRLVRMLVTVKDSNSQLIGSLNKSDFAVFDNGVKQDIAVFERRTEQPLSVALMLDASASVGIELRYELDSASKFLKGFVAEGNPDDAAALYTFDWRTTLVKGYTRRFTVLDQALRQIKPSGGTSMYDAIYLVSQELEDRDGRHVMVIVTDGGDTTSSKDFHQALEAAQRADAVIYPIVVIPISNNAGRNTGGENALTTMSAGTGGRVFTPSSAPELDRAFADILRDLRTQYLIGYYPKGIPPTKDRYHTLKVTTQGRNLRVVTRSGYYGDSDASNGSSR
ncbi:MAG TPA: VWA domain-containing protein [Bryobacteraceae bacterium]|nr:VWA domain-containing protein [Bryobacteraceae bacterium]